MGRDASGGQRALPFGIPFRGSGRRDDPFQVGPMGAEILVGDRAVGTGEGMGLRPSRRRYWVWPSRRPAMAAAARRPAPMAEMTVAAPVTMSPPAKTLGRVVSPVAVSATI